MPKNKANKRRQTDKPLRLETLKRNKMTAEKKRFLTYELGLLSFKAALSTRDRQYPVYDKETKIWQRTRAKSVLREWLVKIEEKYSDGSVSESEHIS